MNDDEQDHSNHNHGVFFAMDPQEHQRRMMEREMNQHVAVHQAFDTLLSLTEEQLVGINLLIKSMGDPQNGPYVAAFFDGNIKQMLYFKYGWCRCGEKHAQPEDLLAGSDPGEVVTLSTPLADMDALARSVALNAELGNQADIMDAARVKREELMHKYRLIDFDDMVKCQNCGQVYVSLRDRMLRDPDDCSGCRVKSAHG